MPSRKQVIYCELLRWGLLHLRAVCAAGVWGTDEDLLGMRTAFEFGREQANFLHRVPGSILEPGYVANDVTFINWAFACHIARVGDGLGPGTAALMLEFYDDVPDELRPQLTWRPSAEFRRLAAQGRN